jgi:signal transduction histidine kinase
VVLDPASARLHQSLRDFLQRQRERDAEVATRLEHTDRLASLGRLAAGLAHEIKNPLAGIQGALEILREDLPDQDSSKLCDEMLAELGRVNQTLQSLLASARPRPAQLSETDVTQLLEDLRRLAEPGLRRRNINLDIDIAADVPQAHLDAAKMRQVLLNLVNNAADAIDGGGNITLRAGTFPDRQDLILAVGGSLELETTPGVGTTFFIFLPTIANVQPPPTDMISSE